MAVEPPDRQALTKGLMDASAMFINEADLTHAVGESGFVHVNLRLTLDKGRVRLLTGQVSFERRVEIRP